MVCKGFLWNLICLLFLLLFAFLGVSLRIHCQTQGHKDSLIQFALDVVSIRAYMWGMVYPVVCNKTDTGPDQEAGMEWEET